LEETAEEATKLSRAREMSPRELIEHVGRVKTAANAQFAAGEVSSACAEYERGQRLLRLVSEAELPTDEAAAWRGMLLSLRLNGAACALRAERHEQALVHSEAALALAPNSTKALFRRGQALHALGRLREAEAAFGAVVEREPTRCANGTDRAPPPWLQPSLPRPTAHCVRAPDTQPRGARRAARVARDHARARHERADGAFRGRGVTRGRGARRGTRSVGAGSASSTF
jgi:tetratricopeptide (TPR) repeat protein